MTTSTPIADERIETYLRRLEAALAGVPSADKHAILREIRAHILDSAAGTPGRDAVVARVLRLLGTPEELARRYTTECMLTRASRSFSPWLLLRTCWRWATLGMKGMLTFMLALVGYGTALALTLAVFLKPFMPSRVGMWRGPRSLNIGVPAHAAGLHEVLGPWFVPVIAVAAFAVAIGTTQALRWLIRSRSPNTSYQIPRTTLESAQV